MKERVFLSPDVLLQILYKQYQGFWPCDQGQGVLDGRGAWHLDNEIEPGLRLVMEERPQ